MAIPAAPSVPPLPVGARAPEAPRFGAATPLAPADGGLVPRPLAPVLTPGCVPNPPPFVPEAPTALDGPETPSLSDAPLPAAHPARASIAGATHARKPS